MAIKGKKKKSGGKAKAAAPRRPVVPPKPRLLARKGVQAAGASLLALILGLVLGWAFWHGTPAPRALTKEESSRVSNAQTTIEGALAAVGQPSSPSDFVAFPDLATSLDGFKRGSTSAEDLAKVARQASGAAKAASTQIAGLDVTKITKGFPSQTGERLKAAQEDLKQALRLYETSSGMLVRATAAGGKERDSLVADATALRSNAQELMNIGFRYYALVLEAAGLQPTSAVPPGISGLPQGNPLPGGVGGLPPQTSP